MMICYVILFFIFLITLSDLLKPCLYNSFRKTMSGFLGPSSASGRGIVQEHQSTLALVALKKKTSHWTLKTVDEALP